MSEVPLDGQVTGGDMSTKVKIKAEKDEIPVKHYKNDDDTEKEKAGIPDGDKAVLHTKLLEQCQQELITVKDKLIKTERQLEKANAYNEDLRGELDKLSSELHSLKRAARENRTDAETQTEDQQDSSTERHGLSEDQAIVIDDSINEGNEDKTDGDSKRTTKSTKTLESAETEDGARTDKDGKVKESASTESDTKTKDDNKMEHDAKVEKEAKEGEEQVSSTSLADELRATAEAAVQQTGYVYDENSGLYYDYNSGYYYNAEKALYYDPNTGTYFYYNSETGKYDFHSLVDLSQYSTGQDSQQYNNYYGQDHSSSDRGGNYDLTRKDYQAHSSHRHSDSGYDQYHRPLPRRDRETSRSSKSYEEYDHHISSQRRDKEGSSRMDSGKKKKTKRLQTEEMEHHKRKKKKKDKDKKKKKKKSSREKRRDKTSERKSEKKKKDDGRRKGKESREESEDGEVRSNDSKERDVKSKEKDKDNKENSNSDEDMENYNLEGKSYMGELYESLDENSNNQVTSEEAPGTDDLYDDLDDDKSAGKFESGDDVSSKSTENHLKVGDQKHNFDNHSNMDHSPTDRDDRNTTHSKISGSSQHHSADISTSRSKNTQYLRWKKTHSSKDSSCDTSRKLREKESRSKDCSSDSDSARSRKSQHHEKESWNTDIRHKKKTAFSKEHKTKTSISGSSRKHESARPGYHKQSSNQHSKCRIKSKETFGEKQGQDIDIHGISGKMHSKKIGKHGKRSTSSRHESVRKTSVKSRRQAFSSDSDSYSESSNSLCTGESELESGEITSSSEEEPVPMQCDDYEDSQERYGESHSNDVIMAEEELVSQWPPCIRVIVTDSDTIDPGNLFIITCTGATVGREKEMGHTILIPDINVSKAHAEIQFDEKEYKYYLTDLSSQNGTFLNEERVSEPKVKSKPMVLSHGDTLQFGCTRLLLHIHDGTDTCDECEPGQVQAQLQAQNQPKKEIVILSKEEKLRQQRQELKKIKKKYGLKNSAYVDNMGAINNPAYNDKADERRKTVGSDNPYQPDEVPASVHRPISEENKGHKMLKKLGWTEGDSLGKDNEGIRQPISVKFRANKSAGLGSGGAGEGSVQEVGDLKRRQKWMNAQRRYNKMDQDNVKIGSGRDKQTLTTPKWVQGETQEGETQEG
ncbi:angiogenic factor with G patch and FHA domains 1-like isoform X1 [Mizuhopecten yessoensis]|uniref:angiogenic factor with G patch and FHA domains 1-like isoform X1 n=1 Tax=Mizuhopecten yessoensis TaxID=6573 RepID=UPI000B45B959|nr:angiogenic factor with G patch and FHA domains 1-like isoform X1 [Mizuhopecten yessoensis]